MKKTRPDTLDEEEVQVVKACALFVQKNISVSPMT